jgi:methionine synthase I (cobalamin-dependent)
MTLAEALGRGTALVCDGAMGTMLHAAGNSLDQALPALNLSDPALVRTIHDSYTGTGVDIIQTNTFGASRLRLAEHGHGRRHRPDDEDACASPARPLPQASSSSGRCRRP